MLALIEMKLSKKVPLGSFKQIQSSVFLRGVKVRLVSTKKLPRNNVFLEFFSTNIFQFVTPSNSKVMETSSDKRNARQQLSEFNFPRNCYERKTYTFVVVCLTLHHCRLFFSGMRFLKIERKQALKGNKHSQIFSCFHWGFVGESELQ